MNLASGQVRATQEPWPNNEDQDDMVPETRWVKLPSLVDNTLDENACKLLDAFAKSLYSVAKEARKRLREDV